MTNIFISYRWDDSAGETGRIHDHLKKKFGDDRVFIDVKGIELGEDIPQAVERTVKQCKVMLVIIGKTWASIEDKAGKKRLENSNDTIRLEILTALKNGLWIIPVLVNDASMPSKDELPDDISAITGKKAAEIRHTDFERGVEILIQGIERIFEKEQERERDVVHQREQRIQEMEKALQGILETPGAMQLGNFLLFSWNSEYLKVESTSMAQWLSIKGEVLINVVERGWSIEPEGSEKSYIATIIRKWNKKDINIKRVVEECLIANEILGLPLEAIDDKYNE